MKRILVALVCLLIGAAAASAQTIDAKVCDILAHPKDFNGKMVRITGTVAAGFDEAFVNIGLTHAQFCHALVQLRLFAGADRK